MCSVDLKTQKKSLREKIRQIRDSLSVNDIISKSGAIEARLWLLIEEQQFQSIMFYIAFGSEARTQECITHTIESGRAAIVPICSTDGERRLIPSRLLDLQSEVAENRFGILEPKADFVRPFPPEKIDLVVVPGLAFDVKGNRIGYGGGYYDRFLARCPQALHVGLAYEMQILENTFPSAWDVSVHRIITEDRIICCQNR